MPYPVLAGSPAYGSAGTSKFIPQIWSTRLNDKFYANTFYEEIANTNYEGEISGKGDEVIIRTIPDIEVYDHEDDQDLQVQLPESPNVTLTIDQGHYTNCRLPDVGKYQSDLNLVDIWANDAAKRMKIRVDSNILGSIYAAAAAVNAGANAGADSASINLGTVAAPLLVNKGNIVDILVENYGVCLDETDTPDEERYVILPPSMCARIKTSELKDASLTGDGNSTLRTGKVGMIDRLAIYSSRHLRNTAGVYDVVFGQKAALTYASQITEMETIRAERKFASYMRSLNVYGFDVICPEQLGHSVVRLG
jgi:hypothetical protein